MKKRKRKMQTVINMRARSSDLALIDNAARVLGITRDGRLVYYAAEPVCSSSTKEKP